MKKKQNAKTRKPGTSRAEKHKAFRDLTKGRICNLCGQYKDREHFYPHPTGFNGLNTRCKGCYYKVGNTPRAKRIKKNTYRKRKQSGECVKCGLTSLPDNVFCWHCWFSDKASQRCEGDDKLEAILKLWEHQNGLCFYSDEKLVPGQNASLDHQLPRSQGGTNEISNLKWVCRRINLMKTDMTHDEFVSMCTYVANKFGKKIK